MGRVLIIGAGGVGSVAAHKCAMNKETFTDIWLASRRKESCDTVARQIKEMHGVDINTAQVDADNVPELVELINTVKPEIVINLALPYQDLTIMDACLETGVHYIDTANYEPRDEAKFEYSWQWAYQDKFKEKGLMATLGSGFDPGVTNVFCAYAQKHLFDTLRTIDILDCNAGDHGRAFATNFNPEINIREVTQPAKHWEKGEWVEGVPVLDDNAVHFQFDYPEAGKKDSYLLYHEEEESLAKNIKGLERIRFWMTFSQQYITHLKVLHDLGLTSIEPVNYEGRDIIPLQFLKAVLPDPGSLAEGYKGKTVIGCIIKGEKDGKQVGKYIYNVCEHERCNEEVKSQAVSYTAGVPPVIAAKLMLEGKWTGAGVFNVEQLDPDPFMEELNKQGLPWKVVDYDKELPV